MGNVMNGQCHEWTINLEAAHIQFVLVFSITTPQSCLTRMYLLNKVFWIRQIWINKLTNNQLRVDGGIMWGFVKDQCWGQLLLFILLNVGLCITFKSATFKVIRHSKWFSCENYLHMKSRSISHHQTYQILL